MMKRNVFPKPALYLLIAGLLMSTGVPLLSRYVPMPDALKGFLSGLGLALEFMALAKAQRGKKGTHCRQAAPPVV